MTELLTPLLSPLSALRVATQGKGTYYRALSSSQDEVLRVGAWSILIDLGEISERDHSTLVDLARYGAIRRRAFNFYRQMADNVRALAVAKVDLAERRDLAQAAMIASLHGDPAELLEVHLARFLHEGDLTAVRQAADAAGGVGGWRDSVVWHARVVALNPTDLDAAASLANLLDDANQRELLSECIGLITQVPRLRPVGELFLASSKLASGDLEGCLADLDAVEERGRTSEQKFAFAALGAKLRGRALEGLGRYQDSFRAYSAMNQSDAASFPKPAPYIDRVKAANSMEIEDFPATERADCVMLLGFPRSGTTLLENALAAHSRIDTLEEAPTFETALAYLEQGRVGFKRQTSASSRDARERYFAEVRRRIRKPGASIVVDKMPIRSVYAPLLKALLPELRYIFSIRHPYDVALSCFKQRFKPNGAMSNFLTLGDTTRLYDLAMTTWFSKHSLNDEHVHYVRYNQLVIDFDRKVHEVLSFLNLEWEPAVLDFAVQAQIRSTRTPSYQKVRQGLSIGVQTYWKNYKYLFTSKETAPLTKWARFFGYETV